MIFLLAGHFSFSSLSSRLLPSRHVSLRTGRKVVAMAEDRYASGHVSYGTECSSASPPLRTPVHPRGVVNNPCMHDSLLRPVRLSWFEMHGTGLGATRAGVIWR